MDWDREPSLNLDDHWASFMKDFLRKGKKRTPWRDRPSSHYRMETLERAHRRGKISKEEYHRQVEQLRDMRIHRGRHFGDDEMAMMDEYIAYHRYKEEEEEDDEDYFDDAFDTPDPNRSEEKYAELEKERIKWHENLDEDKWSMVYAIKNLLSNNIILGNEYHVYRFIEMTEDLREPVFLTKMAYMAVRMNTGSCLKHLLKYGAWVNQRAVIDDRRFTPLHLACVNNNRKCVAHLLRYNALVDKHDANGNSSLLIAMLHGSQADIMRMLNRRTRTSLLKLHINPEGETVLHRCGPFYVDPKAKPEELEKRDTTEAYKVMLDRVVERGELDQLIERCDFKRGHTPLADAITNNVPEIGKLLVEAGARPDTLCYNGETVVHYSARVHRSECLRVLLEGGASATTKNFEGLTPLQLAAKCFYPQSIFKVAQLLMDHGANPEARVDTSTTFFHEACRLSNYTVVNLCLGYGAKPMLRNDRNETPLDVASDSFIRNQLQEEASVVRNLASICKWRIRASLAGHSLQRSVQLLPIPAHLHNFLLTPGHEKPRFQFESESDEEEEEGEATTMDTS